MDCFQESPCFEPALNLSSGGDPPLQVVPRIRWLILIGGGRKPKMASDCEKSTT